MPKLRRKNFEPIMEVNFKNEKGNLQHSVMRESTMNKISKKGVKISGSLFRGPWGKFKEF